MNPDEAPLESPIEKKIEWARNCFEVFGDRLLAEPEIASLLARLKNAVDSSHQAMIAAGMVERCKRCEEEEGGSCCGAGLENRYDAVLLLINLLLGEELPSSRDQGPTSCFFLGAKGCRLSVRQVICVHYLCDVLQLETPRERLSCLQEREGLELELMFQAHDRITQRIRAWGKRS
ncbi:MAG: hypothetical protein KJ645_08665 [Planctomycetes bacterium]|nr:hypothetical protein [Planctomycetota bacterium]